MLTLIRCPFHPRVTVVAHKRSRSFCQKCRWQATPKHAYTHTPFTKRSRSGLTMPLFRQCGHLSGNELTRNLPGNTRLQSSQLAELLWTDPGIKSEISVRKVISTSVKNNKKKRRQGMKSRTLSQNPRERRKSHHHHNKDSCKKTKTTVGLNRWGDVLDKHGRRIW